MNAIVPRANSQSIVAACILSAGLIVSALIGTHRATVANASGSLAAPCVAALAKPPITEEAAKTQLRAQILAAPAMHTYSQGHTTYALQDVKVTQVIYDPKEDNFTLTYDYVWQPAMPSGGPQSDYVTLSNNGYGHYYDTAVLSYFKDGVRTSTDQHADITIK